MKQLDDIIKIAVCLGVLVIIGGWSLAVDSVAAVPAYPALSNQAVADSVNMVASVNDVKVSVEEMWIGDPGITADVTPIRVNIHNNSNAPISLRYGQFWIVSADGHVFSAIPPFQVNGKVNKYELGIDYGIIEPEFYYSDFYVAPYYAPLYSHIGVYYNYVYYNWPYYGHYIYWDSAGMNLPTETMKAHALPEGIIKAGGSVKGYIYFEDINQNKVKSAVFHFNLDNPQEGYVWGEISIPLKESKL